MDERRKIMVVDDQPDTITFMKAWLEDNGFALCAEQDSSSTIATALKEKPSLILLDINMPGMSGIEVYRALKESEPLRRIPVIFVSGAGQVQLFGHGCSLLQEPVARIEKPFDLAALRKAIDRALNGGANER